MKKILFIDRDGTLIEEPADYQVDDLSKIRLCTGVIPALLAFTQAGFQLVMITNQDGLGTASFPQQAFQCSHEFILNLFASQGICFDAIFICPHRPEADCHCRKPKTGLLDDFLKQGQINLQQSWVIGDRETDRMLAENIGVSYLPISKSHGWSDIVRLILYPERLAAITRKTKETAISMTLNLNSIQSNRINTPIPFFNHMLEQVAQHGGFSLDIQAEGDIEVDDHHLIEDTAIVLGEGLKSAIGDKRGIARYGFTLPMDESLATIAIDLCGRSFCDFQGQFTREFVGGMATEMVPHFFKSLASSMGATIHIKTQGENHHHMIEACFKVLGRALRQAIVKTGEDLPSTKGVL